MTPEEQKTADFDLVKKHADLLADHWDSVMIFVSRQENLQGGAINIHLGKGNWFTRYGQVREWMIKSDETIRIGERKDGE